VKCGYLLNKLLGHKSYIFSKLAAWVQGKDIPVHFMKTDWEVEV